jgi:uncharacterized protein
MDSTSIAPPFGPMRRKDREITSRAEIDAVLDSATVVRLGLADLDRPFVVPVYYLYYLGAVYFHSANAGTKMSIIRRNPRVCFEVSVDHGIVESDQACDFEARHRTVIGFGSIHELEDVAEKTAILRRLVARFTTRDLALPPERVQPTAVCRIDIESITGKRFGI